MAQLVSDLKEWFQTDQAQSILRAGLVLLIGLLAAWLVSRRLRRARKLHAQHSMVLRKLLGVVILLVTGLWVLRELGMDLGVLLGAAGILGAYISMSFEKFLIDEELCGMVRKILTPEEVSDRTLQEQVIQRVGAGGEFLSQPETLERCRTEFFATQLMRALDFNAWKTGGGKTTAERAGDLLVKRLASYEKPDIDPGLESDLAEFVRSRKG